MAKDNVDLICDISELAGLFERSHSLEEFLQRAVSIVAYHMRAAVCSIYLFNEQDQTLSLAATQGLNQEAIGSTSLSLGEGLVGHSMQEMRSICEAHGSRNPHFKSISGIHEEQYEAFLAVPILLRGATRVGVLVTQDPQPNYFHQNDVKALRAIASQLAVVIENAKLLMSLHEAKSRVPVGPDEEIYDVKFLKGTSASQGVVVGEVVPIDGHSYDVLTAMADDDDVIDTEACIASFRAALQETEEQLEALQRHVDEQLADVAYLIFNAHLLILKDDGFSGAMENLIRKGMSAERAVTSVVNDYINLFAKSANPRLREKVLDLKDLGHRLLQNLNASGDEQGDYNGQIIVARELVPSDILKFAAQQVEGIIIVQGGVTSHISILARSLRVPVVFLDNPMVLDLDEGTMILMDANQGTVFLNPDQAILDQYQALIAHEEVVETPEVNPETLTRDGTRVALHCNINLLSDLEFAQMNKAEGVGLYRSEFPFIVRDEFPSEEAQRVIYQKIIEAMPGKEVTLRTLDVGGDKKLPYHEHNEEANPFLGLRAIRFSLKNLPIFKQQLRAMLRAGADAKLRIMFPFISSVDDFISAKAVVKECLQELQEEGMPHNHFPKIGPMVELPAAIEIINELAEVSDFLCIGTNDLVQYLLAVDRTNESVSNLYVNHHPAVLRAVNRIVNAAINNDVDISVCGDMALNTDMLKFLIGIGIRKVSMDPQHIPRIQTYVSNLHTEQARRHARKMLRLGTLAEVNSFLEHLEEEEEGTTWGLQG